MIKEAKEQNKFLREQLSSKKKELQDTTLDEASNTTPALGRGGYKTRRVLKGHISKIYALQWAQNVPHVLSASQDGKLIIWNAETSNKMAAISLKSSWVMTCAYSPSGRTVASGGLDNICTIYNAKRDANLGKIATELSYHAGYISCCRYINDDQIITSSGDTTCILWDVNKQKAVSHFEDHDGDVMALSVYPAKNIFVSAACDCLAKVWDYRTNKCVQTFYGHENDINSVQFFPDGNAVATGSDDGTCKLFDTRYDGDLNTYRSDSVEGGVTSVDFSKSGRLLFAGYEDFSCQIWDTLRAERITSLTGHTNRVSCLGISSDGYALCTGSWDNTLRIWARDI